MTDPDTTRLRRLADLLLPGDAARWPSAASVLDDATLGAALAGIPAADADGLHRLEAGAPETFAAALARLYAAYYSTPQVQAVTMALAEAGPKPAADPFDPRLLDGVRERG